MLVVKQDFEEAFEGVNHANAATLIFLHLCALSILFVSLLTARHVVKVVKRRDMEAEQLNKQIMETGKMASIGELSAGVAHEINNPLAIILTEKQILLDMAGYTPNLDQEFKIFTPGILEPDRHPGEAMQADHPQPPQVLTPHQVGDREGGPESLPEGGGGSDGAGGKIGRDQVCPGSGSGSRARAFRPFAAPAGVPESDHERHRCTRRQALGTIRITTKGDPKRRTATLTFSDTGSGIPKEHLNKIFDPFFTTKPVGKGTGLGLSICYGIIQRLGGTIHVESRVDVGTDFTLTLPYKPPPGLEAS